MQKIGKSLFLESLSSESRKSLVQLSTTVSLPIGTVLYEPQEIPDFAYLLTSGIASTITKTRNGDSAEVGLLGHEGVVGSLQLLGPARTRGIDDSDRGDGASHSAQCIQELVPVIRRDSKPPTRIRPERVSDHNPDRGMSPVAWNRAEDGTLAPHGAGPGRIG
jgi:hypothetical protein